MKKKTFIISSSVLNFPKEDEQFILLFILDNVCVCVCVKSWHWCSFTSNSG